MKGIKLVDDTKLERSFNVIAFGTSVSVFWDCHSKALTTWGLGTAGVSSLSFPEFRTKALSHPFIIQASEEWVRDR